MRIQRDFYSQARRPSRGLRRGTVVSIVMHLIFLGALTATAYFFQSPPPLNIIEVGVMFAGLPDAPEGVESKKDASLPPGPPAPKPAAVKAPPAEKKPDPPKEPEAKKKPEPEPDPKPDPKPEKKDEPKKPDPKKKEEKKTLIAKEEEEPKKEEEKKEEKPEKKPVKEFKKGESLSDPGMDELLEEEMIEMASANPPGGGLEGARPSDTAQVGYGDPLAEEYGISVRGMPSILGAWANDVRRAVKRQWREPGGMPIGSRASISFWVSRDGQLLGEPEVHEPSNDASLDQSAITAVKLAAPFRPLPPGYNEPKQQVIFVFTISS